MSSVDAIRKRLEMRSPYLAGDGRDDDIRWLLSEVARLERNLSELNAAVTELRPEGGAA